MAPHSTWSCGHHDCVSGACPRSLSRCPMDGCFPWRARGIMCCSLHPCVLQFRENPLPRQQCRRAPACSIIRSAHKPDELGSLVAVDYLRYLPRYYCAAGRGSYLGMAVQLPGSVAYGTSREGPPRSSHTIKRQWVSCGSPKYHPITSSSYTGSHRGLHSLACKLAASSLTIAPSQPRVPTRPCPSANCPKNSLLMMK